MSKPWERKRGYGKRKKTRFIRNRIFILCEGERTEPNYFKKFPVETEVVELQVNGIGANTLSLVKEAIRRKQEAVDRGKPYNEVWCVFDRDSFPARNFNDAFQEAGNNQIRIAYSNPCFELWYYLHFEFIDSKLNRQQYSEKLTKKMGRKYEKNDPNMYEYLKSRQENAIKNAKKLRNCFNPCNPEKDNPSTTVDQLVDKLIAFINEV